MDDDDIEQWLRDCVERYITCEAARLQAYRAGESQDEPAGLALKFLSDPARRRQLQHFGVCLPPATGREP